MSPRQIASTEFSLSPVPGCGEVNIYKKTQADLGFSACFQTRKRRKKPRVYKKGRIQ